MGWALAGKIAGIWLIVSLTAAAIWIASFARRVDDLAIPDDYPKP